MLGGLLGYALSEHGVKKLGEPGAVARSEAAKIAPPTATPTAKAREATSGAMTKNSVDGTDFEVATMRLMLPDDANPAGNVHGGTILKVRSVLPNPNKRFNGLGLRCLLSARAHPC